MVDTVVDNKKVVSSRFVALHFSLVLFCLVFLLLTFILEMVGGNVDASSMAFSLLLIVVVTLPILMFFKYIEMNSRNMKIELFLIAILILIAILTKVVAPSADIFYYSLIVLFFMGILGAIVIGVGNLQGRRFLVSYENTQLTRGLAVMIGIILLVTFVRITFSAVYGVPQSALYTAIPFSTTEQPIVGELTSTPLWLFLSGYARGFLENTALICLLGGALVYMMSRFKLKGLAYIAVAGVLSFLIIGTFGSMIHSGIYNPEYQTTVFLFTWLVFAIFGVTMLTLLSSFATTNAHGILDGLQELSNAGFQNEWLFILVILLIIGGVSTFMWFSKRK